MKKIMKISLDGLKYKCIFCILCGINGLHSDGSFCEFLIYYLKNVTFFFFYNKMKSGLTSMATIYITLKVLEDS